jgi:hypothetical protein
MQDSGTMGFLSFAVLPVPREARPRRPIDRRQVQVSTGLFDMVLMELKIPTAV